MSAQGIYKITSPTNSIYIGQSRDLNHRERRYKYNAVANQRHVHRSIKKYGWGAHKFEILFLADSSISDFDLNNKETEFYNYYLNGGFKMMNIQIPGNGFKHSEETKIKIGQSNKYKLKGIKLSPERIEKLKKSLIGNKRRLGCKISDAHKQAISRASKGKQMSESTKKKLSEGRKGSKHWMFGKKLSDEHKRKIGVANKATWNANKIKFTNKCQQLEFTL